MTAAMKLRPMTEADFQSRVIELARLCGWRVCHYRPAYHAGQWRTHLTGHKGCPDLILARSGCVLLCELKTDTGRVTPEQHSWLASLGPHARLWRPRDWRDIVRELTAKEDVV